MDKIYIINLKNNEEDYANALEFIKIIECERNSKIEVKKKILDRILNKIIVQVGDVQRGISPRYLEQPVSVSGRGDISAEVIRNIHHFCGKDLIALNEENRKGRYQIRVYFEYDCNSAIKESELIRLQYLAMFLKRVGWYFVSGEVLKRADVYEETKVIEDLVEKELKKHLTVFIVPGTGLYPFKNENDQIDFSTYTHVSRYLRLLSKRYTGVIYGVDEELGQPVVTSLDFRKNRKSKTCFPLLLINEKIYESLFGVTINGIIDSLFSVKSNGRFGKSRDENPIEALEDYIAETNLYHIRDVVPKGHINGIREFLESCRELTLMEFSLFSFMLSKDIRDKEQYNNVWCMAHELSQGLKQVVQNAIQHSEYRECFFSFYLHEKGLEEERDVFVNRISQLYPATFFDVSTGDMALEIFVGDLNDKEDMIDNFISNLEYEWSEYTTRRPDEELVGHIELIKNREKLAVRNFFSFYSEGDAKKEWRAFRQEDLIAHIGLSQFAQTAEKCKASVRVISSKSSEVDEEKNIFYTAFSRRDRKDKSSIYSKDKGISVIPGTKFSILIPIQPYDASYSMGIGQLNQQNGVAENYGSFASFLDYQEKRTVVTLKERGMYSGQPDILDAKRKYRLVQSWRSYWENKFKKNIEELTLVDDENSKGKYIFNYDFNEVAEGGYFSNEDQAEVCMKGLINALNIAESIEYKFLIALTNLPAGVIDNFRKISVQLSVKKFSTNVQLCLHERMKDEKQNKRIVMLGNDFSQAISNSYILSMEHGVAGFEKNECEKAMEIKTTLMSHIDNHDKTDEHTILEVCPFDVLLECATNDKRSIFEKQLKDMVEGALDEELIGYKLNNTHMRLGSKVHIESFYEMSFLFYRTTIANRLAFSVLRRIKEKMVDEIEENKINLIEDNILFYGYSSYSKALLTSINEILKEYRRKIYKDAECSKAEKIGIMSFQHNLMLESEETQMYFDFPTKNFPGKVNEDNYLELEEEVKIVQIVPISSTLTTFDKMWKRFSGSVEESGKDKISLMGNYTVFWVVDQNGNMKKGIPSKIEERYWEKSTKNNVIITKLPALTSTGNEKIEYFIRSAVVWHDPLECELCYPEKVINEIPLVETDPTSTVPTQQVRHKREHYVKKEKESDKNFERFSKLKNCVLYDHIGRRQNHYQFYIDTQQYFYNVKDMVKGWLKEKSKELTIENGEPTLHIIFSPEHNTNVGFVQYVNTYYFNGLAEVVSINVDKQYRSNFICEHAALKRLIEELHRDRHDKRYLPVKFYFVDDTIITGDTLEKANGLLHSLVPTNEYPVNLFSKIFVLLDRLSNETKQMYVDNPTLNFMSFLHINVSNTRTHGDSCIGCKLEQDAGKLFKRSSTRNMADYWQKKTLCYKKKAYDNKREIVSISKEKSYNVLLFSHIMQDVIVQQGNCHELGDCFDIVLNTCLWLLNVDMGTEEKMRDYKYILNDMRNVEGVCILLKTICRPFFSYDFKIKRQLYTFFIFLTELLLGEKSDTILPNRLETVHISYLYNSNRIERMKLLVQNICDELPSEKVSVLDFLKDYLLEGLTDMGSTYVMRMQTFKKVYAYLNKHKNVFSEKEIISFWNSYEVNIHRLVAGNTDESRELWLEYLYMTGMEYNEYLEKYSTSKDNLYAPVFFYNAITGADLETPQDKYFYQFCHNLFLLNTGISYKELKEKNDERKNLKLVDTDFQKDYWRQIRQLDMFENPLIEKKVIEERKTEGKLFELLQSRDTTNTEETVNQWYEKFLNCIMEVIAEKYGIDKRYINIAMLTENNNDRVSSNRIQSLDIVKENINYKKIGVSETRYYIKERVVDALENVDLFNLEQNGYMISQKGDLKGEIRPYVIAFFDNPRKSDKLSYKRKLARVFLYVSIPNIDNADRMALVLRLILREILMYRNKILRFLEKDFAGEIYASYAHTIGEKNILSHEKAHSHNTTADDEISLEIFRGIKSFEKDGDYEVLSREKAAEWLLLRNYTNGQVAKIFNRSFHDVKDGGQLINSPMLYIPRDSYNHGNKVLKHKLDYFSSINLKNENKNMEDGRFKLLNEIIDIQYDDSLNEAEFIQGYEGQFYNLEYFKCILIDMMISAIKYESGRSDYLTRIDRFMEINDKLVNKISLWNMQDEDIKELVERMKESRCYLKIYREESPLNGIDYLVIQNPVDEMTNRLSNWEEQNEIILHRLEDPLDYADGHMSLLAIKRYIENLDEKLKLKCIFKYVKYPLEGSKGEKLYFENRLPILRIVSNDL